MWFSFAIINFVKTIMNNRKAPYTEGRKKWTNQHSLEFCYISKYF